MTNGTNRLGPLFADLYEMTMAAAYFEKNIDALATFSLFVRPSKSRNFFVAAGLEAVLDELAGFAFTEGEIAYLENTRLFSKSFLSFLKTLRFSGDIFAMPEGSIFFPEEPILEVTAPLIEAQIVETYLLNTIGTQSLFASKGARCVHASGHRPLIDFSFRRTQGLDAGLAVARSTYISGFAGTSNLLAGRRYGIPVSGTMAHSYVLAFEREIEAFRAYADVFPDQAVFLIDTYDTIEGARKAARVGVEMKHKGSSLKGVRLDSGNMATLSQRVRQILDHAGLIEVKVYASSGFDEFKIQELLSQGAQIDAFGLGTKIGTSADAPYLDIVYKLVEMNGKPVRKLSPGKKTLAGKKQVFRKLDEQGHFTRDIIGLREEILPGTFPLLECMLRQGKRLAVSPSLQDVRSAFASNFKALPQTYKSLKTTRPYPVHLSKRLSTLQNTVEPFKA